MLSMREIRYNKVTHTALGERALIVSKLQESVSPRTKDPLSNMEAIGSCFSMFGTLKKKDT